MTPAHRAVLPSVPPCRGVANPAWKIADQAGVQAPCCTTALTCLLGMGLVEATTSGRDTYWSRTPAGDRAARMIEREEGVRMAKKMRQQRLLWQGVKP